MRGAPCRLRCEYLDNPLGIDSARPRLSWWLNDARPAELQTAYQIQAASTPAGLQSDLADLWDTGYVSSQQTVNVEYRGKPLASGDRVWWRVRCYDSDGTPSGWSATGHFELGLRNPEDWQAQWVGAALSGSPVTAVPAPVLYRDFELPRAVAVARLYLAVLGSAVAEINGQPVSSMEPLEPWSDLRRCVPYRVWDVTRHLRTGGNRIAVILADCDYCGHLSDGPRQRYGPRPLLCAQLTLELDGGERQVIGTDPHWLWYPSWVLRADRDRGEEVDGRQYRCGWSTADDSSDGYPVVLENLALERFAQRTPPVLVNTELASAVAPRRIRAADGGSRMHFDFGRSLLGRVRLELRAMRDATVTVHYGDAGPLARAEAVPNPSPDVQWAPSVDRYTARGGDAERFEPRFALHVFRYVEIGIDREPSQIIAVTAVELAVAAERTAAWQCDHRLLQALFEVSDRTLHMGLSLGPVSALPAPHRRVCTADAEAILAGAAASRDVAGAFQGWLTGLAAAQETGGLLPRYLPAMIGDNHGEPGEVESLLPCLWLLYRCFGDRRLLEQLFPAVQRYLAGIRAQWPAWIRDGEGTGGLREQMLGTAWYCYALSVATRMAGVLGRRSDLEGYDALAGRVRLAFRARFLTQDGLLVADDQLGYVLALALGLLEGSERITALDRLQAQLRRRGFHPDVDLRHGALLLEVLTLEGRADLAYQVLLQTTAPSWLHPLTGAASLLWDEARNLPGRLAAAAVAGWLQRFLLGLELDDNLTPEQNAYRRMRIQPRPPMGPAFAAGAPVREAAGHLDTVHGRYECAWRITAEGFEVTIRVPGNCGARVVLPDGSERLVVAGSHRFEMPHPLLGAAAAEPHAGAIPLLREVSG